MDLLLDTTTWDLVTDATDLQLVEKEDAVGQHLSQRLKTFAGEWFLDLRLGVPYFSQVLVKNPDPVVLDSVFKSEIIHTPGIVELRQFDLRLDAGTRQLQLSFTAVADSGAVISFSEVLP
jgi:hypothetical protein